jgi:thiopurine S-methyltransferase
MERDFWIARWKENRLGFHQSEANDLLVRHFDRLSAAEGGRVFVPLCGKTLDIAWLRSRGHSVAGVELSELAVEQLFAESGLSPRKSKAGKLDLYSAPGLDIFAGDIFDLSPEALGTVDAVYDRAAYVALPEETRERYARHSIALSDAAPHFLITFEYDQRLLEGPPFSIPDAEVARAYEPLGRPELAEAVDIAGGLKGKCPALEKAWLLGSRD